MSPDDITHITQMLKEIRDAHHHYNHGLVEAKIQETLTYLKLLEGAVV